MSKITSLSNHQRKQAQERLSKMDNLTLSELGLTEKLSLIKGLSSNIEENKDTATKSIVRVFNHIHIDKEFLKDQEKTLSRVAEKILNDKEISAFRLDWGNFTKENAALKMRGQIATLQRIANIYAKEFGTNSPKVTPMQVKDKNGYCIGGSYNPKTETIKINMAYNAPVHNYLEAIKLIIHETSHHIQHSMSQDLQNGLIGKDHKYYNQARIFTANLKHAYIKETENRTAYKRQPIEAHAIYAGVYAARSLAMPNKMRDLLNHLNRPRTYKTSTKTTPPTP